MKRLMIGMLCVMLAMPMSVNAAQANSDTTNTTTGTETGTGSTESGTGTDTDTTTDKDTSTDTDTDKDTNTNTGNTETPQEDYNPLSTSDNLMVGGNWITPVARAGQSVNVVLPLVNMGRGMVENAVVTPRISEDVTAWPFEIITSGHTQTIWDLPGTDNGGTDMERRRELTWTFVTRKDAPSGYMPITYDITYETAGEEIQKATVTTYVNVVGTAGVSADGKASTPRVIVTGFSTTPEVVHAGETFILTLHMENTSTATSVKNMLFDIQAASESSDSNFVAAAFLPTAGSSTIFVNSIGAGGKKDISMELEARSDLAQKPYVVSVNMSYEDENVNAYENTANVSIPVKQEARVDISDIQVMPESIEVGGECNVMFSLYNIGKTKLYNTNVAFVADSISGGSAFLGNVEPGATANVDAYIMGMAPTMDDGTVKILITYEDEAGEAVTIEKSMTLYVNEMYIDDDMMGGFDPGMMEEEPTGGFAWWHGVLIGLVLVGGAVTFLVIKKKKAKKNKEEFDLIDDLDDEDGEDEE